MHLVGYLYEDYHDARSLEHKVFTFVALGIPCTTFAPVLRKTSGCENSDSTKQVLVV